MRYLDYLIAIVALVFLVSCEKGKESTETKTTKKQEAVSLRDSSLISDYLSAHSKNRNNYWLTGEESAKQQTEKVRKYVKELKTIMPEYENAHPEAERILSMFERAAFARFEDGALIYMKEGVDVQKPTSRFAIVFVSANQVGHPAIGRSNNVFYHGKFNAVFITALEMPNSIKAGLLYHEIGHALRAQNDKSSSAPMWSYQWVKEEVEFHEVEEDVFDVASNGFYSQLTRDCMGRFNENDFRSPEAFERGIVKHVSARDFFALDKMLGAEAIGSELASLTSVQYLFSLGFEAARRHCDLFLNKKCRRSDVVDLKVEMYMVLVTTLME